MLAPRTFLLLAKHVEHMRQEFWHDTFPGISDPHDRFGRTTLQSAK